MQTISYMLHIKIRKLTFIHLTWRVCLLECVCISLKHSFITKSCYLSSFSILYLHMYINKNRVVNNKIRKRLANDSEFIQFIYTMSLIHMCIWWRQRLWNYVNGKNYRRKYIHIFVVFITLYVIFIIFLTMLNLLLINTSLRNIFYNIVLDDRIVFIEHNVYVDLRLIHIMVVNSIWDCSW